LNGAEPRSTWRVIVDALRNPVVNLLALARKIEAAHISDPASTPDMAPEATTTTDKITVEAPPSTSAKAVPETSTAEALRNPVVDLPRLAKEIEAAHFPEPTSTRDTAPETSTTDKTTVEATQSISAEAEPETTAAGKDIAAVPESTLTSEPVPETTPTDSAVGTTIATEEVKSKPPSKLLALQHEIKGLHQRFNSIKESTIKCLEKFRITVVSVVYMLTSVLFVFEHKDFLGKKHKALCQCEDHWELFGELNLYWNYLSYSLMDGLVGQLVHRNSAFITIQEQMTVYKEDMLEFRRRTTLVLFCKVSPTILRISEADPSGISEVDLQKMVTEHQWPQTVTLEDVEQFRKGFLQTFSLPECAVMVHRIRTGSFEVTWFVFLPPTIIQLLKESRGRIWVFKDFKVSSAVIDGELVYQPSHHKPATPIPLPASEMTATTTDPLMEEAHCVVPS
jgi:hypothetical protein